MKKLKANVVICEEHDRRSYVMNLLMIFGIGYLGGLSISFGACIRIFLGAWMDHYRIFCGSRAGDCITPYP